MDGIWQQNIVDEWKNGGKVEVVLGSVCSKILKSRVVVVVVAEDDEVLLKVVGMKNVFVAKVDLCGVFCLQTHLTGILYCFFAYSTYSFQKKR